MKTFLTFICLLIVGCSEQPASVVTTTDSDVDQNDVIEITSGDSSLSINRLGDVMIDTDAHGEPLNLMIMLESIEAQKLEAFTSGRVGDPSEIKLNGKVISSSNFGSVLSSAISMHLSSSLTAEQVSSLERLSDQRLTKRIDPNLKADGSSRTMLEAMDQIFSQD